MRPLKFKFWDTDYAEMLTEDDYSAEELGVMLSDHERYVPRQYTGIDEDDKEIYEGDIIDFTVFDIEDNDTQYRGVVTFAGGMFQLWKSVESEFYGSDGPFELYWVHLQDDELKVLGNIHENPELLEVEHDTNSAGGPGDHEEKRAAETAL
ncbi:YopX family protein [Salibacterium qingdaonense]|uniref:Phage uncharacterized protein TIGR01671 n=1 Tax=Salibacterium qingdaonense TaxID=266892 RepID=A0A1I4Q5S8_9BACI|nr:YopX family protein [Salibacterium qingdaonense]SFM35166.1 phage uncharacterized protein TIGR01671 [Salibacterium qingdaonense]